ncbi:CBS domain-containing protein [Aeromonas veronii]|nr:CBS domain-containing protein [Aeromonas veronii]
MPQTLLPNIIDFIAKIDPFDQLPLHLQQCIAKTVRISYLGHGESLPFDINAEERYLYVVRTGALEQRMANGVLRARLGPDDLFGFTFLESTPGNPADCYNVTAIDDTLLYQIPHSKLKQLLNDHPQYANLFAAQARERLQSALNVVWSDNDKGLFMRRVSDIHSGKIAVVDQNMSIQDVAREMRLVCRTSTAVVMAAGKLIGIITDRDMTLRVIAEGVSSALPISHIMTKDPITIHPDELVLKAASLMMQHNIRGLPIVREHEVLGLLTTSHLVHNHRVQAIFLIEKIKYCESVDALSALTVERQAIFEALVEGNVPGENIGQVMALIMDAYCHRLLQMGEARLGPPPCDYVWLAAGSQARNEVHMLSDQDSAIVMADQATEHDRHYFRHLAMFVCNALDRCGYPLCSGHFMAAAHKWCQPMSTWKEYYRKWIGNPEYDKLLNASVFLELRALHGNTALCDELQQHLNTLIAQHPSFTRALTRDAIETQPPLGIFKNLVLEKDGHDTPVLNIKRYALTLIIDLARIYGMAAGCTLTGTEERFMYALQQQLLSEESYKNIIGAYRFTLQVRYQHQLNALKQGLPADNLIRPDQFGSFERKHLKDAFRIIGELQDYAKLRFIKE